MAIAFVNSAVAVNTGGGGTLSAATGAFSATTGNLIVIAVRQAIAAASALPISVTDTAGNQYRRIASADSSASSSNLQTIWYAYNITGNASNVITAKWLNNNASSVTLIARQYSGLSKTSDPFDTAAVSSGSSTTATSASFSTANPNEVIIAFVSTTSAAQTYSAGLIGGVTAGNVAVDNGAGNSTSGSEDLIVSSTQSGITAAMSFTTSAPWEISVVTFSDVANANSRFDYTQSSEAANISGGTSIACTLNSTPTQGDLICVAAVGNTGHALSQIKDGNNNVYTITANSPSSVLNSTAGSVWLGWLIAPANAHATITASFAAGNGSPIEVFAVEFVLVGGTASFDTDLAGHGSTQNTNSPTLTPVAGELLIGAGTPAGSFTGVSAPWVLCGPGITTFATGMEMITNSSSGSQNVIFTQGGTGDWDTMGMAFKLVASFADTVSEIMQFQLR